LDGTSTVIRQVAPRSEDAEEVVETPQVGSVVEQGSEEARGHSNMQLTQPAVVALIENEWPQRDNT